MMNEPKKPLHERTGPVPADEHSHLVVCEYCDYRTYSRRCPRCGRSIRCTSESCNGDFR